MFLYKQQIIRNIQVKKFDSYIYVAYLQSPMLQINLLNSSTINIQQGVTFHPFRKLKSFCCRTYKIVLVCIMRALTYGNDLPEGLLQCSYSSFLFFFFLAATQPLGVRLIQNENLPSTCRPLSLVYLAFLIKTNPLEQAVTAYSNCCTFVIKSYTYITRNGGN